MSEHDRLMGHLQRHEARVRDLTDRLNDAKADRTSLREAVAAHERKLRGKRKRLRRKCGPVIPECTGMAVLGNCTCSLENLNRGECLELNVHGETEGETE